MPTVREYSSPDDKHVAMPPEEQAAQPRAQQRQASGQRRKAALAPWITSVRRYSLPRLEMPSSLGLPPVLCCQATSPSHAEITGSCEVVLPLQRRRERWH